VDADYYPVPTAPVLTAPDLGRIATPWHPNSSKIALTAL
jgi:hypothetical protein